MNDKLKDAITDTGEILVDKAIALFSKDEVLKEIPILKYFAAARSVYSDYKNSIFSSRIIKLISSVEEIAHDEFEEFKNQCNSNKEKKRLMEHLTLVLDDINEEEKIDIIINIFISFLEKRIDAQALRRYLHFIDKSLYSDLYWLKSFDGTLFLHKCINLQGLIGTTFVIQIGVDGGNSDEDSGGFIYIRTNDGEQFCKLAFPSNSAIISQ